MNFVFKGTISNAVTFKVNFYQTNIMQQKAFEIGPCNNRVCLLIKSNDVLALSRS